MVKRLCFGMDWMCVVSCSKVRGTHTIDRTLTMKPELTVPVFLKLMDKAMSFRIPPRFAGELKKGAADVVEKKK